jgi:peptidoglycan/LPS O-acetylase OafA/YrhL
LLQQDNLAGVNAPCSVVRPEVSLSRVASLDGLRGVSIWAVILAHASSHFSQTLLHEHLFHTILAQLSYFGVTVFFVISGFLITMLLRKEYLRSYRVDLRRFYRRRAVRILPAGLLYIGVVIALGSATRLQAVYALTFTTSYFFAHAYIPLQQLWSLSVEEQFYLVWPLVFILGVQAAKRTGWTVMFLCPILRLFLDHWGYSQTEHLAPAIADSVAAGCLLSLYREEVRAFVARYFVSGVGFFLLCATSLVTSEIVFRWKLVVLWGLVPCMIALIISAAIERRDRILNRGPLVWSGLLSYSLYLWQQPFLVLGGPLNLLSVRLGAIFLAAYLSYRFVEQPALKLFRREVKRSFLPTTLNAIRVQPDDHSLHGAATESAVGGAGCP